MKASKFGILSALLASVCCLGPVLLVLLGLGSLGFGSLIGRYHGWFIGAAAVLLTYAWRSYLKESQRCRSEACEMVQRKTTRTVLIIASAAVAIFMGLNLYTYASPSGKANVSEATSDLGKVSSVVIPIEGMTCFTCELSVETSLKRLSGVHSVDARTRDKAAYVDYDASRVNLDEIIAAINKTGYKASQPTAQGG